MLGCCILPHSASLWGRGTIAPRDGGGGTSGAPPPPRLRFASPRSPGPQMQSHLGEDAAASDAPCIRPLASSPTALRCGGGGPSRLAMVVGGRQRYVPGTSMTGARPQPILSACRGRKHVPCLNVIVWWIWWSIMVRPSLRLRASSASRARAHTSGCRASARADARRSRTRAGLASRDHSGQHPCAHRPVLDAASRRTTPFGLTSHSTVRQQTPTAELHPNVCGRCGFVAPRTDVLVERSAANADR